MPLPEDQQRRLQEMEQALCRDDPKFGRLIRALDPRVRHERRLLRFLLGVVIGAGLLAAGPVTGRVYLETAGVLIVLVSLVWAGVSWRRYAARVRAARFRTGATTAAGTTRRPGQTRRARMMERLGQRLWGSRIRPPVLAWSSMRLARTR